MTDNKTMGGYSFIDDKEKMVDFLQLGKEEFLKNYSYLTENDWNFTAMDVLKKCNIVEKYKSIVG